VGDTLDAPPAGVSGHHDNDGCFAFADEASSERPGKLVAILGGSTYDDLIRPVGGRDAKELCRGIPADVDERDLDRLIGSVSLYLSAKLLGPFISHQIFVRAVGSDRDVRPASCPADEHGDGLAAQPNGFAARPPVGVPRGVGAVNSHYDHGASRVC
jgi:hypothetical protein